MIIESLHQLNYLLSSGIKNLRLIFFQILNIMNYLFALYLSKDIDRIRQRKKYIESLNDKKIKVEVNKPVENQFIKFQWPWIF